MGIYAVTGGSSGIGAKTVEYLRAQGHLVYNIDVNNGDISANLASPEGRQEVIEKLHILCARAWTDWCAARVCPIPAGI